MIRFFLNNDKCCEKESTPADTVTERSRKLRGTAEEPVEDGFGAAHRTVIPILSRIGLRKAATGSACYSGGV